MVMKKLFTVILAVVASVGMTNATIFNGYCGRVDSKHYLDGTDLQWSFDTETKILDITGSGQMASYKIDDPAPWEEYKPQIAKINLPEGLTTIGSYAFRGCIGIESIVIPSTVDVIYWSAFENCSALSSVAIPSLVYAIYNNAFAGCSNLSSVTFANPSLQLYDGVFSGCTALETIELPANLTSIPHYLFQRTSLSSITLPSGITSIGDYAFEYCKFTSIDLPDGVRSIGAHAFHACSSLTSISLPDSISEIPVYCFYECSHLATVKLPSKLTAIQNSAFSNCSFLERPDFPEGLEAIRQYAFRNCISIDYFTLPASLTILDVNAFDGIENLSAVNVAEGNTVFCSHEGVLYSADTTQLLFFPPFKLNSYTAPVALKRLQAGVLNNKRISTLYFPGVEKVDSAAIMNCSQLREIHFSAAVNSIAVGAFIHNGLKVIDVAPENPYYMTDDGVLFTKDTTVLLKYPDIKEFEENGSGRWTLPVPNSVRRIVSHAFSYLENVSPSNSKWLELIIPDSLEEIEPDAFKNTCPYMWMIQAWNRNVPTISENTFSYANYSPTYFVDWATYAHARMMLYVPYLDYKFWANAPYWEDMSITRRHQESFEGTCGEDVQWTLTWDTKELSFTGSGPMYSYATKEDVPWDMLRELISSYTIPTTISSICDYAFAGDTALKEFNFYEGLTTIGNGAFDSCVNLAIPTTLPATLVHLGDYAFRGCKQPSAWTLTLPSALEYIGAANFVGNESNGIDLPDSLKYVGDSAFYGCHNITYILFRDAPVEYIGNYAFADCGQTSISATNGGLPKTLKHVGDYAFAIFLYGQGQSVTKYFNPTITDSVQYIGQGAFLGRKIYDTDVITLPEKLAYIGDSAFFNATTCHCIRSKASVPPTMFEHSFSNWVEKVYVPVGSLSAYKADPLWNRYDCRIGDYSIIGYAQAATSVEIELQCSEADAAKIDHLEADGYEVVMLNGSNNHGSIIGLEPGVTYDFNIYAVSTGGDRVPMLFTVTTSAINLSQYVDILRADSFFRFTAGINAVDLTEGLGFELQTIDNNFDPVGDTMRIQALINVEYNASASLSFFADTILLNYGEKGETKYRVRAYYYDAEKDTTYYSNKWTNIQISDSYSFIAPFYAIDTVCVESTKATLKVNFAALGSLTISGFVITATDHATWTTKTLAEIAFEGNMEQTFTISGFEPETTYWVYVSVTSTELDYPIGEDHYVEFTTRPAPQGIEDLQADGDKPVKVLHEGQIYILRGEKVYTVTGQEVR